MLKKTFVVLAFAMLTIIGTFKSFGQKKLLAINKPDETEIASVPIERVLEDLKVQNQELAQKNAELENRLNQIEKDLSFGSASVMYEKSELGSRNNTGKLEQNTPNPFKEKTIIRYYVPAKTKEASIKIYSLFGSELLSFPIVSKEFGEIEFSGKTLSAGTFTYILIIDGKAADTKQMVLTR